MSYTRPHALILQADADSEDPMKAILAGLKARHEKTGEKPILIHTVCPKPISPHSPPDVFPPKVWNRAPRR